MAVDFSNRMNREDSIMVGGSDHQRSRGDEGADISQIPAKVVGPPHAVAVAVYHPIVNVRFKRRGATCRSRALDPLVTRGDPPGGGTTSGDSSDPHCVRIHIR